MRDKDLFETIASALAEFALPGMRMARQEIAGLGTCLHAAGSTVAAGATTATTTTTVPVAQSATAPLPPRPRRGRHG